MKTLTKLFSRFEAIMTAAAFAEEGEFQTAREIMREADDRRTTTSRRRDMRPDLRAKSGARK